MTMINTEREKRLINLQIDQHQEFQVEKKNGETFVF